MNQINEESNQDSQVDRNLFKEYRCPSCNKLLSKGYLGTNDSYLEVKCRGCRTVCLFRGEDKEIIIKRAQMLTGGENIDEDVIEKFID
ncbi:MAG: hypothetical protein R3B41_00720 [Candidatus Doudnabacteria bacterium]